MSISQCVYLFCLCCQIQDLLYLSLLNTLKPSVSVCVCVRAFLVPCVGAPQLSCLLNYPVSLYTSNFCCTLLRIWLKACGHFTPGVYKSQVTEFCMVLCNIFWSSVWDLYHVTLPAPRILRWLSDFWKICAPQFYSTYRLAV